MRTDQTMRDVLYALLPATLAGIWYFGVAALLVILASIAGLSCSGAVVQAARPEYPHATRWSSLLRQRHSWW